MKIELFDFEEFIDLNDLKAVTSPIVFQRGNVPDPYGLLSVDIFGIDVRSRKNRFAYANLGGHFFHPHVYKSFRRLFRNVERIINGSEYYSLNEDGILIKDDENGETGIDFLYNNWEKIHWERNVGAETMRNERIDILTKTPKNQIFIEQMLIIPVFYRDIQAGNTSGGGETDPLNNLYSKLIRMASLLKDKDMFDFTLHSTNYGIENILVEIYDTFKHKIEKKNGMIRKFLMGKNVDNCVRSVISCPLYHDNSPEDTTTNFGAIGVPISQICSLAAPYMMQWLKSFFDREFISNQNAKPIFISDELDTTEVNLYKPELYFTDKYIEKMMDRYMHDPEFRFDPIMVPIAKDKFVKVALTGKKLDPSGTHELSTITNRPMTVTDLLYMASYDVTRNMHALITRYPVSDAYGMFVAKPNPVSTLVTEVVKINETIYKHYPKIDMNIDRSKIGIRFIDTLQFSNSYLDGLGGDYDGDQVTIKLIWSQEANEECDKIMNSKSFFISPSGENVRKIKYEVYQTFYDMTREPYEDSKILSKDDKKMLLDRDPKDYTFDFLTELFANKVYNENTRKSRFETTDIVKLAPNEYHNKTSCTTTVGRIVWNKIMIDRIGMRSFFPYNNNVLTKKMAVDYEKQMTVLLKEDDITTEDFRNYINHRDWLGLQLHGLITISFTEKTMKTPLSVKKLRDELFEKYDKELQAGDIVVANKVEKTLIDAMVKIIKDDPGFDLYNSGARGDINNHMKNIFLMRGGVLNPNTGKYEIMKTSFNDGLRKEDFTAASNSVVQGAYPKAVGTADSGYLAKQLMAGNQTEVIDEEGSDCGTKMTLNFVLEKDDLNDFQGRYINDNGKKILLTSKNISNYLGKEIKLYTPMFCIGDKLCEKCAGKQDSKFIGLNSNKIATTLTNLNMKKFHDSTLRFNKIDPNDMLIENTKPNMFTNDGTDIILTDNYFEIYVPDDFFANNTKCEDLGDMINLFGEAPVGVFTDGNFSHFDTLNIPAWNKFYVYDSENRVVNLPGIGSKNCTVYKYNKGHKICISNLLEDASNAQLFLRDVTYGKVPGTIPYDKSLFLWRKNQHLNKVNFGVPSVIQEVVLACAYRYKKDPNLKFAKVIGRGLKGVTMYDYEMASIRRICQVTSTFTGITFEAFDDMVTTSINRSREKKNETDSPLEMLFKL